MTSPDEPPADPLGLLCRWLSDAAAPAPPGGDDLSTAVLATVNEDGQPTTRVIEVRAYDDRGLVFLANLRSRKGRDLNTNPVAAATLAAPALTTRRQAGWADRQAGRLPSSLSRAGRWPR